MATKRILKETALARRGDCVGFGRWRDEKSQGNNLQVQGAPQSYKMGGQVKGVRSYIQRMTRRGEREREMMMVAFTTT